MLHKLLRFSFMKIMSRIYFFILTTLFLSPLAGNAADADEDIIIFARYEPASEQVVAGDSTKVNVVVYCNYAFQRAECSTKTVKVKGGHWRLQPRRGDRQQQRVRVYGGVYYAILWDTYIVGSDKPGEIKFPQLQFDCDVEAVEPEVYVDPFDPFGFFSSPRHKTHKAKARCKCPALELPVISRPKRSTQEVISSGGKVA